MTGDRIRAKILGAYLVPDADEALRGALGVGKGAANLGILSLDRAPALYAALDAATVQAPACAAHICGNTGVIAADDPADVRAGLAAAVRCLESDALFESAAADDSVVFFAHCIPRAGSCLSALAGVPRGTAAACLFAPLPQAAAGLDAALKAAPVELKAFYGPPSERDFAGGLLTGAKPDCAAACAAFAKRVRDIAARPVDPGIAERKASAARAEKKPEDMTLLRGDVLVPKTDGRILLRGRVDSLEAKIIETAVVAKRNGLPQLAGHLDELLLYTRRILAAEVNEAPFEDMPLFGMDEERLHYVSHNTKREIGVGWVVPDTNMCETGAALNALRTEARECELAAVHALCGARGDIVKALNRLSSAAYILVCRLAAGFYKC